MDEAILQLKNRAETISTPLVDEELIRRTLGLPGLLQLQALKDARGKEIKYQVLEREIEMASDSKLVLFLQTFLMPNERSALLASTQQGALTWVPISSDLSEAVRLLREYHAKDLFLVAGGLLLDECFKLELPGIFLPLYCYQKTETSFQRLPCFPSPQYPHLRQLEAESIFIIREAIAESQSPALLYSLGKDSSVLLHLLQKAFHPIKPPVPLVHVDTRYKFQEMYAFRDYIAEAHSLRLIRHVNPEAVAKDINPFEHGSRVHTDITKTQGLKQVLQEYKFDVVFGGARRDEEKSRSKERVFSLRTPEQGWDPRTQRPELWQLYNTRLNPGESFRVFPLSNWTELDVWKYIDQENIPVVPLYFSKVRPVVRRDGMLLLIDDNRLKVSAGETIEFLSVRFRTLGCYPLSGAVESQATTVAEIIRELEETQFSERQGRKIDFDGAGSMEQKKREGYF